VGEAAELADLFARILRGTGQPPVRHHLDVENGR
jgi:hypothetical protein